MLLTSGTSIGRYQIVEWIGAGGMGEVYRARDTRLDRDVAVKLIPEALAGDASRVRRFEDEARAAGQLNHPNILSVYDVGVHGGRPYIVSELLEGRSLRDALSDGALPWRKAVQCAREVAEGLAAAHDRRIVHRDVKPDNVFLTHDGRVKILDFGIAKLTADEPSVPSRSVTDTAAGSVIGTAAYMSPEQIRGELLDGRSDLFSVGAILYEMLAGRPAFARATPAETMAAVLKDGPELPDDVAPGLARIVSRCLEKMPESRFQSARDLAFGLDMLSDTGGVAAPRAASSAPGRSRVTLAVAATVLGAVAITAVWSTWGRTSDPPDPFADAKFTTLTDWEGTEALAEISPDGKFVVFLADKEGQFDIWLTQVGASEPRNLTKEIPPMSAPGAVLRNFGFSGDGEEIWFSVSGRPGDRKMLMPMLGGMPRPFLGEHDVTPSWSPDGSRVVYFNNTDGGGDPMFVADRSGADARQILPPEKGVLHNHNPVWSPDGKWIYFVRGVEPTTRMDLWRIPSVGGAPERLTDQQSALNYLAAVDPRTLAYVARSDDRSGPWLWALEINTKIARRVSTGLDEYTSISASRDGRRMVATIARPSSSLWTVPIQEPPAEDDAVVRHAVTATAPRAAAPRVGRDALLYLSARGADVGLWRFQDGRALEIWRGQERALSEPPAVSVNGEIALAVQKGETRHLIVMAADGSNVRSVAPSLAIEGTPGAGAIDWSPNGKWIVAGGRDASGPGLFKVALDGTPPIKLVEGHAVNPVWSPLGNLIVYAGAFVNGQVPLLGVSPDRVPVRLPDLRAREGGYRFLPNGSGIVFLPLIRSLDFWLMDVATGQQHQLTRLTDHGRLQTFDITPDGKQIVFDRLQENSDIVLIERPQ